MYKPLDSDEIRLLTAVGFLASARGDACRGELIFSALEKIRPAAAYCFVGLAIAYLNAARADDAVRVLQRGLGNVKPEDLDDVHAFLGLALHLAGHASASVRALEASQTPLARAMLGKQTLTAEVI